MMAIYPSYYGIFYGANDIRKYCANYYDGVYCEDLRPDANGLFYIDETGAYSLMADASKQINTDEYGTIRIEKRSNRE